MGTAATRPEARVWLSLRPGHLDNQPTAGILRNALPQEQGSPPATPPGAASLKGKVSQTPSKRGYYGDWRQLQALIWEGGPSGHTSVFKKTA